jgi:hypothetical protein
MLTYADVCLIRVVVSHTQAENGALEALIITNAHVAGLTVGIGAQFTGFTGTNAQILTAGSGARHERTGAQFTCIGAQFTCFTGTNAQVLIWSSSRTLTSPASLSAI